MSEHNPLTRDPFGVVEEADIYDRLHEASMTDREDDAELFIEAAEDIARLRKFEERYRWLVSQVKEFPEGWYFEDFYPGAPSLETLEDVIDVAMKQ